MYYMRNDREDGISLFASCFFAMLGSFVQYKLCQKSNLDFLPNIFFSIVLFFVLFHATNGIMYLVFKYKDRRKIERINEESRMREKKERIEKEIEKENQKDLKFKRKNEIINNILKSPAFVQIATNMINDIKSFKFQGCDEHLKTAVHYFYVDDLLNRMNIYQMRIAVDHFSELVEALAIYCNSHKDILETSNVLIISLESYKAREDSPGFDALKITFFNKNYIEPQFRL